MFRTFFGIFSTVKETILGNIVSQLKVLNGKFYCFSLFNSLQGTLNSF